LARPLAKFFLGKSFLNTFLTPTSHLLISRSPGIASWCGRERTQPGTEPMIDFIFIAIIALFFVAGGLYACWCEKL
jgi:hypothetical protein